MAALRRRPPLRKPTLPTCSTDWHAWKRSPRSDTLSGSRCAPPPSRPHTPSPPPPLTIDGHTQLADRSGRVRSGQVGSGRVGSVSFCLQWLVAAGHAYERSRSHTPTRTSESRGFLATRWDVSQLFGSYLAVRVVCMVSRARVVSRRHSFSETRRAVSPRFKFTGHPPVNGPYVWSVWESGRSVPLPPRNRAPVNERVRKWPMPAGRRRSAAGRQLVTGGGQLPVSWHRLGVYLTDQSRHACSSHDPSARSGVPSRTSAVNSNPQQHAWSWFGHVCKYVYICEYIDANIYTYISLNRHTYVTDVFLFKCRCEGFVYGWLIDRLDEWSSSRRSPLVYEQACERTTRTTWSDWSRHEDHRSVSRSNDRRMDNCGSRLRSSPRCPTCWRRRVLKSN